VRGEQGVHEPGEDARWFVLLVGQSDHPSARAWPRLLIVVLESAQGVLRQLYLAPALGDLQSRQLGVATGTINILLVAFAAARWVGVAKV